VSTAIAKMFGFGRVICNCVDATVDIDASHFDFTSDNSISIWTSVFNVGLLATL
jgi:hypothetical protein